MPFREKFKKAFGIHDENNNSSSSQTKTKPVPSSTNPVGEGVLVGRRRPIDRVQKERMDQYSFNEDGADRKVSMASQYSPMGSKLPSRHNSGDATSGGLHKSARGTHNPIGRDIQEDETADSSSDRTTHDRDVQGQSDTNKDGGDVTTTRSNAVDPDELSKALSRTETQVPATGM